MSNVSMDGLVPVDRMRGEDDEETQQLKQHLVEATKYVQGFKWCRWIKDRYFGIGVGGVVAVFLFRIDPASREVDEWLWVVSGDLPTAYLVTDQAPDPVSTLVVYCQIMEDWIRTVRAGGDLSSVYPIATDPSLENAIALDQRIAFMRREIIPAFEAG